MSASKPDFSVAITAKNELTDVQFLDHQQRGRLILSACQAAAMIERGKIRSGLPASKSDEWPESTWRFLKECIHRLKERNQDARSVR
jgi:hypothetical protein